MVDYGYDSGFKAIRNIHKSMISNGEDYDDTKIEKYTKSLLNRTCPGWIKK